MASQLEEAADAPIELYCWSAHPAKQRREAAWLAAIAIVCFALLCGAVAGWWLALLALVVLAGSLNRFMLCSRFSIDAQGITADYPLRTQTLEWRDVRRFERDRFGGFLSTRAVPSRLDAYRGMHLLFGDSRDEDIRQIETHMASMKQARSDLSANNAGTINSHSGGETSWAG